jgi:hypothetical protein
VISDFLQGENLKYVHRALMVLHSSLFLRRGFCRTYFVVWVVDHHNRAFFFFFSFVVCVVNVFRTFCS